MCTDLYMKQHSGLGRLWSNTTVCVALFYMYFEERELKSRSTKSNN